MGGCPVGHLHLVTITGIFFYYSWKVGESISTKRPVPKIHMRVSSGKQLKGTHIQEFQG